MSRRLPFLPVAIAAAALALPAAAAPARKAPPAKARAMTSKTCKDDNLHRSICMVELILADLSAHYDGVSGGGVSEIRQLATDVYAVSLPQEERKESFTYTFEAKGGTVTLKAKVPGVKSY
jgi:hypothetical protein